MKSIKVHILNFKGGKKKVEVSQHSIPVLVEFPDSQELHRWINPSLVLHWGDGRPLRPTENLVYDALNFSHIAAIKRLGKSISRPWNENITICKRQWHLSVELPMDFTGGLCHTHLKTSNYWQLPPALGGWLLTQQGKFPKAPFIAKESKPVLKHIIMFQSCRLIVHSF